MGIVSMPAIRIPAQRKLLNPSIGRVDSFDGSVVLLDDVVEVLRLAHLDAQAAVGLKAHDGRGVGAALDNYSDAGGLATQARAHLNVPSQESQRSAARPAGKLSPIPIRLGPARFSRVALSATLAACRDW